MTGEKTSEMEVDETGLALLAGDSGPASRLEPELSRGPGHPEELAQMSWWHYWNGDYPKALELLSIAHQRHPNVLDIQERLAWTQVELQRYADALQILQDTALPEREMAAAVASWKAQDPERALRHFNFAARSRPEWGNSKWVAALYSPTVVQAIDEMRQEADRRKRDRKN
jgi:tetratricopeptide (TPR) repeat protein